MPAVIASTIMQNTKSQTYRCVRNNRRAKPYEIMGLGSMEFTKSYKFIWFGDVQGPNPVKSEGVARRSFRAHRYFGAQRSLISNF